MKQYSKCVECSISLSSLTQRHLIVIKNPSNNYRVFNCIISILKQILDSLNNTLLYSFNQLILREMDCFRWTIKDHVAFTINPRNLIIASFKQQYSISLPLLIQRLDSFNLFLALSQQQVIDVCYVFFSTRQIVANMGLQPWVAIHA